MRHPFATEPHRQRAVSMVAVIIVFINRRHSIHDDVDEKKQILSFLHTSRPPHSFYRWLLFYIFSRFQFFFRLLCFTLYFVFVIRFGFFGYGVQCWFCVCTYVILSLFSSLHSIWYCCGSGSFYDSSVTDLWKTVSIIKPFSSLFSLVFVPFDFVLTTNKSTKLTQNTHWRNLESYFRTKTNKRINILTTTEKKETHLRRKRSRREKNVRNEQDI